MTSFSFFSKIIGKKILKLIKVEDIFGNKLEVKKNLSNRFFFMNNRSLKSYDIGFLSIYL